MRKEDMTPADVTAICTAGQEAWDKLGPNGKQAKFTWRGNPYVVRHEGFRLCVDTPKGEPIACRWE